MWQLRASLLTGLVCLVLSQAALAQIDPEKREFVQLGFNQTLEGAEPILAYGFLYLNEPNCPATNITLRLAFAGVYLDGEAGFAHLLGPNTDLGIGLAGGGFADSYWDFAKGNYLPGESFFGHAAEVSASIYHLFDPGERVPLYGILRIRDRLSIYQRDDTGSSFTLPPDHWTPAVRAGLRFGGREPTLRPDLAMELSAWYEGQFRTQSGSYGFNGDRILEQDTHLFWGRGLFIYTLPESKQMISATLDAGTSIHPDRFTSYRLGGDLPLGSEFPLAIPGYYYQELSARAFVNFAGEFAQPLDPGKHWKISALGGVAEMDYTPGLAQPGHFNSGVGVGLEYFSPDHMWHVMGTYGYGFEAIRDRGRGGQNIGLFCEINLNARNNTTAHGGLMRFLQRIP